MSEKLQLLLTAFEQSPENETLLQLILEEYQDIKEYAKASSLIKRHMEIISEPTTKQLAANTLLADNKIVDLLNLLDGNEPFELILKAKGYAKQEKYGKAYKLYQEAIELNPVLEDKVLELELRTHAMLDKNKQSDDEEKSHGKNEQGNKEFALNSYEPVQQNNRSIADKVWDVDDKTITFSDIGGLDEVKNQIKRRIILPFKKPSLFQKFRKKAGGGMLLYGPPGCGKTMLAKATAGECDATFFPIAISDVLDMYIGESEKRLSAIFETARQNSPSVIFFDELEAIAATRKHDNHASAANLVSQFLSEMDGFSNNNEAVLIIGATNVPWSIDPAFRRPGRFDRVQFIPPPDQIARIKILNMLISERPCTDNINVEIIAKKTQGFSGADLANLMEIACDLAIDASLDKGVEVDIDEEIIMDALYELQPTTAEWLSTASNYARYANDSGQYNDILKFIDKYGRR